MSGAVIAVIVAVVVVIAIVAAVAMMRGNGTSGAGLKRRFGPEYERTLAQHDGDEKATREELAERVKRYGDIERQPVSAQQREQYGARWAEIQAHFVDDPGRALNEADRLIAEVAAERGYPAANSPEHFDALSVHHPHEVQGYRQAHALADHAGAGGRKVTEDMRQAMVSARALFDDMLRDADKPSRTTAPADTTVPATDRDTDTDQAAPAGTAPAATTGPVAPTTEPVTGSSTDPAVDSTTGATTDATDTAIDRTTDPTTEPVGTSAAARDRDDADARLDAESDADPDAVAGTEGSDTGEEHHRPLADRFAGLTGAGRRGRTTDDHS
ncbi:hypothetical protein GA0115240_150510 [Streptomyces sp. DvalAA-14]|uniref:hypothetical protein n=1 Tax=unclassified Streptomyces TaxID=2593676 RepID=UPI00081B36EB|nr:MULTISPECIES: hypothetical protein [unclassified Streptomyces]MYS23270.1 hypothetical protein [Streptomyces sp. SID4948]SCE30473.1 hypothetical protein GA0115240_150510 [Streptomyces sp. DvalAA-14]